MNYLDIGHDHATGKGGCCWFYQDKLLVKENTSHSDWLEKEPGNPFGGNNFACGRYDKEKKLISFVGYSINPSKASFIKKLLVKRFDGIVVDCT